METEDNFVGVVCSEDQKKLLYDRIDSGLGISFLSGAFVGLSALLANNPFACICLFVLSFVLYFVARYLSLRILFTDKEEEDNDE